VLVLDLGVPHNVAPELQGLSDNLHVVDLDGLKAMMDKEGTGMFRYTSRGEEAKRKPDLCMTGIAAVLAAGLALDRPADA